MRVVNLNILLLGLTISYLTLGLFSPESAGAYWAPYAGLVLVTAIADITLDVRRRRVRGRGR